MSPPNKRFKTENKERHKWDNFVLSEWTNDIDGISYYDLIILLPSGVQYNLEYSVKVADCGMKMLLDVKLPSVMSDISVIKQVAKKTIFGLEDKHPLFSGFTNWIKNQGMTTIGDEIWKFYEIVLHRKVEPGNKLVECVRLKNKSCVVHA